MMRKSLLFSLAVTCMTGTLQAQASEPDTRIRRIEVAMDIGFQASRDNNVSRGYNAPVSIRYGAVNSEYRFTIDQRLTFTDQRVYGGKSPLSLDTQLGWRLGSRERISKSVLGPYVFTGFNLTGPHSYFPNDSDDKYGYYGVSAGIGTRIALLQMTLRPKLVVGRDFGVGSRGDVDWVPARNRIALRIGYGYAFRIGD